MHYQLRWFYLVIVFVTLFAIGYQYRIKPLRQELSKLILEESQLSPMIRFKNPSHHVKKKNKLIPTNHSQPYFLREITDTLNEEGLHMQEISIRGAKADFKMQLKLRGSEEKWLRWVSALSHKNFPIALTDFFYEAEDNNNEAKMTMTLLIFNFKKPNSVHSFLSEVGYLKDKTNVWKLVRDENGYLVRKQKSVT